MLIVAILAGACAIFYVAAFESSIRFPCGLKRTPLGILTVLLAGCSLTPQEGEPTFELSASGYRHDTVPQLQISECRVWGIFPRHDWPATTWSDTGLVVLTRMHNDTPVHSRSIDSVLRSGTLDGEYLGADTVRLTLNVSPPVVLYGRRTSEGHWDRLGGSWACDSSFARHPDSIQVSPDTLWRAPLTGGWTYSPSLSPD